MLKIDDVQAELELLKEDVGIPWKELDKSTIFITGATGLIGETLTKIILEYSKITKKDIRVVALVRNKEKAEKLFGNYRDDKNLMIYVADINNVLDIEIDIDYIVHTASITSSKMFIETPVDTIITAIKGTTNVLELARKKTVKSMVYLSSMEVYGTPLTDDKVLEDNYSYMDHLNVRSSYPESKKMVECLCVSYERQYNVPVKIARLTQTFGPGVDYNDGRVFAEFARCIIEGRDIILHTKGETKRNYLYTFDAVSAILIILLKGASGEAYNVANEQTYCSILEMAQKVCKLCVDKEIKVQIQIEDENKFGYAPVLKMNLDTTKVKNLGWSPRRDLMEMFSKMILSL